MVTYEITYHCVDDDWLSWRLKCKDYHDAIMLALSRLHMAGCTPDHKLANARLIRVEAFPPGWSEVESDLLRE